MERGRRPSRHSGTGTSELFAVCCSADTSGSPRSWRLSVSRAASPGRWASTSFPRSTPGKCDSTSERPSERASSEPRRSCSVESTIRNIIPPRDLQTINDDIGVPTPLNLAFVQTDNIGSQDADVLISLRPGHGPTAAYRTRIREELGRAFPDTRFYFQPADIVTEALGFGTSAPVEVSVVGTDLEESSDIALRLRDRLRAIPGIVDARVVQVFDRPALRTDVDRERAARLGLSQRDVANNVLT